MRFNELGSIVFMNRANQIQSFQSFLMQEMANRKLEKSKDLIELDWIKVYQFG